MLSDTARKAGVKPAVAMTIPKRCAIANRPAGYKCGRMHPFPHCDPQAFFVERKMDARIPSTSSPALFCSVHCLLFHRAAYTLP
jgi:hypothetical protein